ncbi:unnamed protein product [Coccothraustes coccothraustes]
MAVLLCKVSSPGGSMLPPLQKRLGGGNEPPSRPPEGAQRQQALRDLRRALALRDLRPPQGSAAEHRGCAPAGDSLRAGSAPATAQRAVIAGEGRSRGSACPPPSQRSKD